MFFEHAFKRNQWLWFHILAGGLATKIFLQWLSPQLTLGAVLGLAIAWEVIEFFAVDVEKVYGDKKRFFSDAVGDIIGAVAISAIMIF